MVEARNFTYMFYGFLAAWMVVLFYVISLARRGSRLKKELDEVRQLFGEHEADNSSRTTAERVR